MTAVLRYSLNAAIAAWTRYGRPHIPQPGTGSGTGLGATPLGTGPLGA